MKKIILMMMALTYAVLANEVGKPFVQMGHNSAVTSVAISPDGKFLVTGSYDNTAKLLDIQSGKEIRTFRGHSANIYAIAISPDGKFLVTGSYDSTAKLWDIETGKEIRTFKGHNDFISCLAISSNSKFLATGSLDGDSKIWDIETGKEIRTFSPDGGYIRFIAITPDSKFLVTGSNDNTSKLWDIETGKEIKTFTWDGAFYTAITPNGKYLVIGSSDKIVKLLDIQSGKEIRTFKGHSDTVGSVAISPDGRSLVTGSDDNTSKLWDIETGKEIRTFKGHSGTVDSVAISPDGRSLVTESLDTLRLWDIQTAKEIRTFKGHNNSVDSVAISHNGKYVATGSDDNTSKLWDIETGKEIRTFKGHSDRVSSVAISPDGKYVVTGSDDNTSKLWDIETAKEIRTFEGHSGTVGSVAISPDGKSLVTGSDDKTAKLLDIQSGKEIRTFNVVDSLNVLFTSISVAISHDGRYLITRNSAVGSKLWDIESGKELKTFENDKRPFISSAISPDGKFLVTGSDSTTWQLWDIASGKNLFSFYDDYSLNSIISIAISPDSKSLVTGSNDHKVKLWDIETGKEIRTFKGHSGTVGSVAISPDGRSLVTGSLDNTTRLWDIATGKEIAQFVSFDDGEWVVITPEGYFNASPNGANHLNILLDSMTVAGIDAFYDTFYRPDIVSLKLAGEDISKYSTLTIMDALKNLPPKVEVTKVTPKGDGRVNMCYKANSYKNGGIGEVRLYHNGKLFYSDGNYQTANDAVLKNKKIEEVTKSALYDGIKRSLKVSSSEQMGASVGSVKGETVEQCHDTYSVNGDNEYVALAYNKTNTISSELAKANYTQKGAVHKPKLYVVAIGINEFISSKDNLKYAVKDAQDFSKKIKERARTIFEQNDIIEPIVLTDKMATKENITQTIKSLASKVHPEDRVVIFSASHGIVQDGSYYMITHDYKGVIEDGSMIGSNEFVDMTKNLPSFNQLIILDTCHAGGMDKIINGLYDSKIGRLAKKTGMHIYASANSKQEALDGYKENGLFTHTLLKGLDDDSADLRKRGVVSVSDLGEYSKAETNKISKELGTEQTPTIINFGNDIDICKVNGK